MHCLNYIISNDEAAQILEAGEFDILARTNDFAGIPQCSKDPLAPLVVTFLFVERGAALANCYAKLEVAFDLFHGLQDIGNASLFWNFVEHHMPDVHHFAWVKILYAAYALFASEVAGVESLPKLPVFAEERRTIEDACWKADGNRSLRAKMQVKEFHELVALGADGARCGVVHSVGKAVIGPGKWSASPCCAFAMPNILSSFSNVQYPTD